MAGCGYTHNQPLSSVQTQSSIDIQVYEVNEVDDSPKQIGEDIRGYSFGQTIEIKTFHELQPIQQASLEPEPDKEMYEFSNEAIMTQTSSCMYAPSQRTPVNQRMNIPNVDDLGTQQVQDFPTIAAPSMTSTCNEPTTLSFAAEPASGMTGAEYFSTAQLTPEDLEGLAYSMSSSDYAQVPSLSVAAAPTVEAIDQSVNHAQVPDGYVLPARGIISTAYLVAEKSISRKRRRNAQISYGTDIYCSICNKEFGILSSLQNHMRIKHQETRPFRCNICGKTYLTEEDLCDHLWNHDPSMKRHKCQSCEKSYRYWKDCQRHFETHHGTPSYVCEIEGCSKAFTRRDHLMAHYGSHEKRRERQIKKARLQQEKENKRKQRLSEM